MKLEIKNSPKLNMAQAPALQQSLLILQMSVGELSQWLSLKIEQNPLLEYAETRGQPCEVETKRELDFEQSRFEVLDELDTVFGQAVFGLEEPPEDQIAYLPSLSDHLMHQAREVFFSQEEIKKVEEIIGSLDERGFLGDTKVDEAILKVIQGFDPPGIAARDLKESLLLQLERNGKKETAAYRIVRDQFNDLLRGRLRGEEIKDILTCNFSPGRCFCTVTNQTLIPDIILRKIGDTWSIEINEAALPRFLLKKPIFSTFAKDDLSFLRSQLAEGKWILRSLKRRRETLERIVRLIVAKQAEFFNGSRKLHPFSIQEAARALALHESTVARAIVDKVLSCPSGMFSLRSLFSAAAKSTTDKQISRKTVIDSLRLLIEKEDKLAPHSDEEIAHSLKAQGISCARRTVAKYRAALNVLPSHLRRKFSR